MRPTREHATHNQQSYMISTETWGRRSLFRNERWAQLLINTLYHYRQRAYLLHEFVVMPDHVHVLMTPSTSLEKAVQFIKGGFSYRAKKELGSNLEVWQKGFSDHRIRDESDYKQHVIYIRENPVRKHLCERAEEYCYCSAFPGFELDDVPQGLKPVELGAIIGAAEAAPLQSNSEMAPHEAAPLQGGVPRGLKPLELGAIIGSAKAAPLQSNSDVAGEAAHLQSKSESGVDKAAPLQNTMAKAKSA